MSNMPSLRSPRLLLSLVILLVAASAYRLWPRHPEHAQTEIQGPTMGTTYTVKAVHAEGAISTAQLRETCEKILAMIDTSMSTYRDDSELMRFNAMKADQSFAASVPLFAVLDASEKISQRTDGYFDVTVGPLVNAWGFGRNKGEARPTAESIALLLQNTGYQKIKLDPVQRTVSKTSDQVVIDLSAIAPGYAADLILDAVLALGATGVMVDVGGEFRVTGNRADGKPWTLGIEQPDAEGRVVAKVITVHNKALATSGDYRNFRTDAEGRIAHGIDPHTGSPSDNHVASVTVIADTAMEADALATAFMVAPLEKSWAWAVDQHIAVLLMLRKSDGTFEVKISPAFQKCLL